MLEKASRTITKIVWQYTEILPEETMEFLRGIAEDYGKVKRAVFERFSGIRSLGKLASVFNVMTEMRSCGLREQLNLPSAYYEVAVKEAAENIKSTWSGLKNEIRKRISANENLCDEERFYLRFALKNDSVYTAILNGEEYSLPEKVQSLPVDRKRLNNLLRRLTRKHLEKPTVGKTDVFSVPPVGYSYKNGTLRLASRVSQKRVTLPLRDDRTTRRQIRVCLRENYAVIAIPVDVRKRRHADFQKSIYVHLGYQNMCTLSSGKVYGKELGQLLETKTERLTEKNRERNRLRMTYRKSLAAGDRKKALTIERNNLGFFKYRQQKSRERAEIETYINAELNRMLETEKPAQIVITSPVPARGKSLHSKTANRKITESFRGYIRNRLKQKCELHSVELTEISAKGTGSVCSQCGADGRRLPDGFVCEKCGYRSTIALNGARNIEQKYRKSLKDENG